MLTSRAKLVQAGAHELSDGLSHIRVLLLQTIKLLSYTVTEDEVDPLVAGQGFAEVPGCTEGLEPVECEGRRVLTLARDADQSKEGACVWENEQRTRGKGCGSFLVGHH